MRIRTARVFILVILIMAVSLLAGPTLVPDTQSFIQGSKERAVLYPFFLKLFEIVFKTNYLYVVVFIQSVLHGVAYSFFAETMAIVGGIKKNSQINILYCISFSQLIGISIMDKCWYPSTIWSEGISYPFCLISISFLLLYLFVKSNLYFELMLLLGISIFILTRKQLLGVGVILLLLVAIKSITEYVSSSKKSIYNLLIVFVVTGVLCVLYKPIEHGYDDFFNNGSEINSYDSARFINIMYFADENDGREFSGDQQRVFEMAYSELDAMNYLDKYASGLISDTINRNANYDAAWQRLIPILRKSGINNDSLRMYLHSIEYTIIRKHLGAYFKGTFARFFVAIVHTVSYDIMSSGGHIRYMAIVIAVIMWCFYTIGMYVNRNNKKLIQLSFVAIALIVSNAMLVSMLVRPIFRYMLYNFPIFYSILFLEIVMWLKNNNDVTNMSERDWNALDKFIAWIRYRQLDKFVKEGFRVADVGCGRKGALLYRYKNKIKYGLGFDFRQHDHEDGNLKFVNNKGWADLSFEGHAFDLVFLIATLEHLDDANKMFLDIRNICDEGGIFVMTTPTIIAKPILEFMAFKLHIINEAEILEHKHYYNKEEIKKLYEANGFTMLKYKKFCFGMNSLAVGEKING